MSELDLKLLTHQNKYLTRVRSAFKLKLSADAFVDLVAVFARSEY